MEWKQIKRIILLYDGTANASVPITVAPNTYINCLGYGICIHEAYNNILDCATVKLPHDMLSMASLSISQDHHRPFVLAQITSLASSAPMSLALHPACPDYDPTFSSQPNDFGKSFDMTFHGTDGGWYDPLLISLKMLLNYSVDKGDYVTHNRGQGYTPNWALYCNVVLMVT